MALNIRIKYNSQYSLFRVCVCTNGDLGYMKGALSRYSGFSCPFFAVENGGEATRGRGASQRETGQCHALLHHQFRASRSIDVGVSVSYRCNVIPLSDENGL